MARRGKKRRFSVKGMILLALSLVFALIGMMIYLRMGASIIPDASEAYFDLANGFNSTVIGDNANTLATSSTEWLGYLWVILPFAGAVTFLLLAFMI